MKILFCAWAAIAFTIYFIEFARLDQKIRVCRWQPFNRKPFNCEACLPIWAFAAFLLTAIYVCPHIPATIATACTCGIITPLILKRIRR